MLKYINRCQELTFQLVKNVVLDIRNLYFCQ